MLKRGKKAQFYLLAAIVIIALVIGFFSVTNYSKREKNTRVNELAEELKTEGQKILEIGAATGNYPWDSFTKNFSVYAGEDVEVVYVIGNQTECVLFRYDENGNKVYDILSTPQGNILGVSYDQAGAYFNIRPGENFYFIIIQNINGEKYVATNEE